MVTRWRMLFAAGLALGISVFHTAGTATAGHPLGTEDAGTAGKGNVEVEFNCERSHDGEGSRQTSLGNTYTLGVLPRLDLAVSFAYLFNKGDPVGHHHGVADGHLSGRCHACLPRRETCGQVQEKRA